MKKRWKIFWTVSGLTALAGAVLIMTGLLLGGTGIVTHRAELPGLSGKNHDIREQSSGRNSDENTVSRYNDVRRLKIHTDGAGISIRTNEEGGVLVDTGMLSGKALDNLRISAGGEELNIELKYDWYHTGEYNNNMIYISVPKNITLEEVDADIRAGRLEADSISANEMTVDVGAGEGEIKNCSVDCLDASCGAGQLLIDGTARYETKLECDAGKVILTAPGEKESYDYEIACGIGDVQIGQESYSGIDSSVSRDYGNDNMIQAECGIGRIEIRFAQ